MNEIQTHIQHPRPPRSARILANKLVTTILRSRWHAMRSNRLLLLTFTGRKSGKEFTTPLRYKQEGEALLLTVMYPWWKNLAKQPAVRVLLRGEMRVGIAEVLFAEGGAAMIKIHLQAT